jgi:tetratricopeptide (TPR) repeat protein
MSPVHQVQSPNRRLDSWKEIAAFFDRDERTVKRWEKEKSLPVHRFPGGSRARVFAFTGELERWMHSPDSALVQDEIAATIANGIATDAPAVPATPTPFVVRDLPGRTPPTPSDSRKPWLTALVLLAIVASMSIVAYRRHQSLTKNSAAATHMVNPEAQELYLQGRYYWNKRTPEDLTKAVDLFTQAIVHDPDYSKPYVGLADCYNLLREFATMPSQEAFPRALAAAQKAVELDPSSAEAHASLAFDTFYWSWDVAGAEREFRRAIELNPNYVAAHQWYANVLMVLGRFPEALKEIDRAQELDPSSNPILADKALILFHMGHPDEAIALLKRIEASQPRFFSTHQYLSVIYLARTDYRNYLAEARRAAELSQDEHQLAIVQAAEQGFKSGGERGMFENIFALQKKFYAEGQMPPFMLASTAAMLGRKDDALRFLQISYRQRDPSFIGVRVDHGLRPLYGDPAFRKLVEQAGFPPLT